MENKNNKESLERGTVVCNMDLPPNMLYMDGSGGGADDGGGGGVVDEDMEELVVFAGDLLCCLS